MNQIDEKISPTKNLSHTLFKCVQHMSILFHKKMNVLWFQINTIAEESALRTTGSATMPGINVTQGTPSTASHKTPYPASESVEQDRGEWYDINP